MTPAHVIGTAGHIDHGKTALVEALTGVWTDRLPEERARGISIDLGFAPLDLGAGAPPVSVVDVPGHEAFVKNMVAGATGIDTVLFVVAADEGMMPQSREHLLVLSALGVERGVVAVTKADLVDAEWLDLVVEAVREELAGGPLAGSPVVAVSARTGAGVETLKAELARAVAARPARALDFPFRLPVDRAFGVAGAGTVVTGTVWSGAVAEGETVTVLPGGGRSRVRSVQVHGEGAPSVEAGRRAALALPGLDAAAVRRGATVVSAGAPWRSHARIDAVVRIARAAPRPLVAGARVRLHHGTRELMARIRPYGGRAIEAGAEGVAMLLLEAPLVAAFGDRFVLRSYSPVTTIGGGRVVALDPPRLRGAARRARGEELRALADAPAAERLARALAAAGTAGVEEAELPFVTGLGAAALAAATAAAESGGDPAARRHGTRWFAAGAHAALGARLVETLTAHHAAEPLQAGLALEAARQRLAPAHPALVEAAIAEAERSGRVARSGATLALAGHAVEPSGEDARLAALLRQAYAEGGIEPPDTADLAARLAADPRRVRVLQQYLERRGEIVKLASDWYADAAAIQRAQAALVTRLSGEGAAETGVFKELFGVSRKYLIPLLEYFDRSGVTRREGNRRVLA
jgi:selenocysteine-specific elongation factor